MMFGALFNTVVSFVAVAVAASTDYNVIISIDCL